jgi:hypothetical protein
MWSRGIAPVVLNLGVREGGGAGNQRHAPTAFIPSKEARYLLYRRLRGLQGRSGRVWRRENLLRPLEFELRIVQPVASHYTDYAIPAPSLSHINFISNKNNH